MPEYIPYSIRHNIIDKDLAGLLDFLEREMGWEICQPYSTDGHIISNGDYRKRNCFAVAFWGDRAFVQYGNDLPFGQMNKDLFFATYRTLLPAIRDLYSK